MNTELRSEIYRIGNGITGLVNNFYFAEAEEGITNNYCVFSQVSTPNNKDTGNIYEENYIQFSLYGKVLADLEAIEFDFKNTFDNAPFVFTNYTLVSCSRQTGPRTVKLGDWYQTVMDYKIELHGV